MKNVAVVGAPEDDGVVEESGGRRDAAVCVHGKGNCRLIFFFENFTFIPRLYFFNIFPNGRHAWCGLTTLFKKIQKFHWE